MFECTEDYCMYTTSTFTEGKKHFQESIIKANSTVLADKIGCKLFKDLFDFLVSSSPIFQDYKLVLHFSLGQ